MLVWRPLCHEDNLFFNHMAIFPKAFQESFVKHLTQSNQNQNQNLGNKILGDLVSAWKQMFCFCFLRTSCNNVARILVNFFVLNCKNCMYKVLGFGAQELQNFRLASCIALHVFDLCLFVENYSWVARIDIIPSCNQEISSWILNTTCWMLVHASTTSPGKAKWSGPHQRRWWENEFKLSSHLLCVIP